MTANEHSSIMDLKHSRWQVVLRIRYPVLWRYYQELLKNERLACDELLQLSLSKRRELLSFSMAHVPYYHRRFAGLDPRDIKSERDWCQLPILTRQDVVEYSDDLRTDSARNVDMLPVTTGGSAGHVLKVYHDRRHALAVLGWRMMHWWGVSPSVNIATCWRALPDSKGSLRPSALRLWRVARRRVFLDASRMNSEDMESFIARFNIVRPQILQGYVGALDALADFVLDRGMSMYSPKAVWLTAAPVSGPQRAKIQKAYGAPAYDQYGCSEVYWLAAECARQDGLHAFSDARHIEAVRADGASCPTGQVGDVIVTDLENRVFPLIRYRVGDRASILGRTCPCGISLPLISPVRGRISDNFVLPDGTVIAGESLTTIFDNVPTALKSFQVVQKLDQSIEIRVVVRGGGQQAVERVVADLRHNVVRHQVPVVLKLVNSIEHDRGKIRYVLREKLG